MTQQISLTLPASTLTVSGTVNGVETDWTNTEGYTWQTVADRADNDTYLVVLTIINTAGQSYTESLTLYYGVFQLVTDRTQQDVSRYKALRAKGWAAMTQAERDEWAAGLKGAYNAIDLNRVEQAVAFLAGQLVELDTDLREYAESKGVGWDAIFDLPYAPGDYEDVETTITWSQKDVPSPEDMARYLGNVKHLRDALAADYPALPDNMRRIGYQAANNIERCLELVYEAIDRQREDTERWMDNTAAAYAYSGEIYTGEMDT
jgi:hypothetical protein